MRSIFSWFIYRIFNFFKYFQIITDGITYGIFPRKIPMEWSMNFFFSYFPSVNPSVIILFYYQQKKITDEIFTNEAFPSVIPLVN
jgi:hypothetical protein